MIEEVRERRIKIFEIAFGVIIVLLLIWLGSYELFFHKEDDIENNPETIELQDDQVDESNIYDAYTSSDRLYTLTIVKTTDQKAFNDAKEKYETSHINENQGRIRP